MKTAKELMEEQWNRRGVVNGSKPVRWFDEGNPLKGGYKLVERLDYDEQGSNGNRASRVQSRLRPEKRAKVNRVSGRRAEDDLYNA